MDSYRIASISDTLATLTFDLHGEIKEANPLFCTTMGYSNDELRGKHHKIFCAQEYVNSTEYEDFWERLRNGESYSNDCLRFKKNGDEIWLRAIYIPVRNASGEIFEIFKMAFDVTERLLEEVDSRSQLIAINKSQARVEFGLDGTVLAANDNFLTATGYKLQEIIGKHHRIFCPSDYAASSAYQKFWQDLKSEASFQGDFLRKAKDGSDLWLRASYSPVYDVKGQLKKIVKFAWDITEEQTTKLHVMESFETTASNLSQYSDSLTHSGEHLKKNSEQSRKRLCEFQETLQTTCDAIDTLASAMKNMDSCIAQISENASGAAGLSLDAVSEAKKSKQGVDSLKQNVNAITEIVSSIDKIAANTNLLALNATIEASRAGEAGRGFSVVANEVKNLSNQTHSATKNIDLTAATIRTKTDVVSSRITSVLDIVELLNQIAVSIADSVKEQTGTTQEVTRSIGNILDVTQRSQHKMQQTTLLAEENLKTAETLEEAAQQCGSLANHLQKMVSSLSKL